MHHNIVKYIKSLQEVYTNAINIVEIRKNFYEIELPIFLNTGDAVDLQMSTKDDEYVVIKNELYKSIERKIEKEMNNQNLKKDYFLHKEKFSYLKKSLIDNGIEINLLLEKKISKKDFQDNFINEILIYSFEVTRYYNYIYDYLVENLRGEIQSKVFKEEIKDFIKRFNEKREAKNFFVEEITDSQEGIVSSYNLYYKAENKVITGINSKVHLWEAIKDIESIKKKYEGIKSYILIDQKKKNDLSEAYIEKIFSKEKDIKAYNIKTNDDFNNFEKLLESNNS